MESEIINLKNKLKSSKLNEKLAYFTKFRPFNNESASFDVPPPPPPPPPPENEYENGFSNKRRHWRFNKKAKCLIAIAIIVIILVPTFVFLPKGNETKPNSQDNPVVNPSDTPNSTSTPSIIEQIRQIIGLTPADFLNNNGDPVNQRLIISSAQGMNKTVWSKLGSAAWQYFQFGTVNSNTGLPSAGTNFPYFTDWDLGAYIQAVIDAQKINATTKADADWRIDKVLTFLETRNLTSDNLPYWWYQAVDGGVYAATNQSSENGNIADAGNLLVALKNVELYNSNLTQPVEYIVNNKTNYASIFNSVSALANSVNIYDYYVVSGFACFNSTFHSVATKILDNIYRTPNITLYNNTPYNVTLPMAKISCEPLLLSIFELPQNQIDPRVYDLMQRVYLAHEGYYNATGGANGGKFRAFSEGCTLSGNFVYQWVVMPDGRSWVTQDEFGQDYNSSDAPIIYTKVAVGFLSLYNTTFAKNMCVYIESTFPIDNVYGYYDGVTEKTGELLSAGGNSNAMIVGAAKYYILNN